MFIIDVQNTVYETEYILVQGTSVSFTDKVVGSKTLSIHHIEEIKEKL